MRRSICFPFPTLENRTKIDWEPVMGSRTIHAKLGRICNHVGAEKTNWIGGGVEWRGNSLAKIFRTPLVRIRLSVFFYNSSSRKKKNNVDLVLILRVFFLIPVFVFQTSAHRSRNQFESILYAFNSILSHPFADACSSLYCKDLLTLFIYLFYFIFFLFSLKEDCHRAFSRHCVRIRKIFHKRHVIGNVNIKCE